jgi:carboxymethylenebutenolidase
MCDEDTVADNEAEMQRTGDFSRRGFGVMTASMLAACATSPADAKTVTENDVKITTPDGVCDAYFVRPSSGKHPAVLVWPDIAGLRPAFRTMGKRLAESGYAVLTVNPFYRSKPAPVIPEGASFQQPEVRAMIMPLAQALNENTHKTDAIAFTTWLDQQAAVNTKKKIGTTGYCMGGPIVFRTAAARPDRIGGAATFHGGGLATTAANSPHLLIPQMKADFLICVAENDDKADPTVKDTLRASFAAAKLPAEIEVYKANHGWCAIDSAAFNQAEADRAWARLLVLFDKALA